MRVENFLTLTKENGVYLFGADFSKLTPRPVSDPATSYVAIEDKTAGIYREVSLAELGVSDATQAALDLKANTADLGTAAAADTTDFATAAQGATADSAVQPGDLGGLALKDKANVPGDLNVTGTPDGSKFLRDDGSWQSIPGGGDLLSSNNLGDVANDAASLANLGGLSTRGSQTFNSSGTFTTPANSTTSTVYRYRMVGGGGAGGYGSTASSSPGGGGGGANVTTTAAGSGGTAGAITGSPNILSIAGRAGGPRIGGTSGSAGAGGNGAGSILGVGGTGGVATIGGSITSLFTGYGSGGGASFAAGTAGVGKPGVVIIDWVL